MKKLITFTFLFVTPLAFSQESRRLVNFLENINRDMNVRRTVQCEGLDATDEENQYQCAVDLCGRPEELVTGSIHDKNIDQYIETDVTKRLPEIIDPVKKIGEQKKANEQEFVKAMEEKLKDPKFLDFSTWEPSSLVAMSSHMYFEHVSFEVDKTKPISERIKIEIDYPEGASREYKQGLKEYAENSVMDKTSKLSSAYYGDVFTKEELAQMYFDLTQKFVKLYDEHYKASAGEYDEWKSSVDKYRTLKIEDIKHEEMGGNAWNLEWSFERLAKKVNQPLPYKNIEVCAEKCKNGVLSGLKALNVPEMVSKLKTKLNEMTENDIVNPCKAELLSKGMKESDKERFLKNFPAIKKNFIARSMAGSSAHSKEAFEKYLDERIHLSFKVQESGGVEEFIKSLQDQAKTEVSKTDYSTYRGSDLISTLLGKRDYMDRSEMRAGIDVCHDPGLHTVWDAFAPQKYIENPEYDQDPTKDNIFVSLFSCTHEIHGKGVVSHEMGHALSYALYEKMLSESSEVAYNEIRNCVTKAYVTPPPGDGSLLNREGDSLRTEEDMADVMSFLAMADEKVNYVCALLDTDMQATKYTDFHLINSSPEDSHSSPLHRALMEAIYKKRQISNACKKVIEANSDKFRFGPCL